MRILLKNFFCGILGLALMVTTVPAQSTIKVTGTVIDAESRESLFGANVFIEGRGLGTATDQQGRFQLENLLEGNYTISATHIGYTRQTFHDVRIPRDQPLVLNFRLTPLPIAMNPLEISAERWLNGPRTDQVVIKQEEISRSNYHSVGEILQQVPGLEIENSGALGSSQKISIRGSQANHVLVLLDGVPLNDELGGSVDLSTIPANIIEKVEIHKGGNSARFGNGAIGGVIRISTKSRFKQQTQLNCSLGAFGAINLEPGWSGNYQNLGYFLAFNFTQSDGDYPFEYRDSQNRLIHDTRRNANFLAQNWFGRVNYRRADHSFSLQAQQLNSERGLPGKIYGWTAYAQSEKKQQIAGAEYQFNTRKINFVLNYRFSNETTRNSNLYPDDAEKQWRGYKYDYQYQLKNRLLNATLDYLPSDWLQMALGYTGRRLHYRDENFRPTLSAPVTTAQDFSHGFFLNPEIKLLLPDASLRFLVTPAVRYDEFRLNSAEHTRREQQWSPGLGGFLSWGRTWQIFSKASAGRSFRVPTFADLFYQDTRIEGKPDLRPEKSRNFDFGAGGQVEVWGKLAVEVTHFQNIIDDLIVWRLGSFEVFRPFNTDARITGEEYLVSAQTPHDWVTLELGYTRLQPLNKNKNETTFDKIIPYRPKSSFKLGLGLNVKNAHAAINYRDVGERFITEANTKAMPAYQVWDANFGWNRKIGRLEFAWKFSVFNLADEKYEIIRDMPLPPREWRVGISVTY